MDDLLRFAGTGAVGRCEFVSSDSIKIEIIQKWDGQVKKED